MKHEQKNYLKASLNVDSQFLTKKERKIQHGETPTFKDFNFNPSQHATDEISNY